MRRFTGCPEEPTPEIESEEDMKAIFRKYEKNFKDAVANLPLRRLDKTRDAD